MISSNFTLSTGVSKIKKSLLLLKKIAKSDKNVVKKDFHCEFFLNS